LRQKQVVSLIQEQLLPLVDENVSIHVYYDQGNRVEVYSRDTPNPNNVNNKKHPSARVIAKFPVEVIPPLLNNNVQFRVLIEGKEYIYRVGGSSGRNPIWAFRNSAKCVNCGIEGVEWRLCLGKDHHLSLKLHAANGRELTRDHIVPRSKYHLVYGTREGRDSWENSQVMCAKCNNNKSDTMPEGIQCWFDESTWGDDNWII